MDELKKDNGFSKLKVYSWQVKKSAEFFKNLYQNTLQMN
jgi:hypothetical protein